MIKRNSQIAINHFTDIPKKWLLYNSGAWHSIIEKFRSNIGYVETDSLLDDILNRRHK